VIVGSGSINKPNGVVHADLRTQFSIPSLLVLQDNARAADCIDLSALQRFAPQSNLPELLLYSAGRLIPRPNPDKPEKCLKLF
jgi:hypothetical protein